MPGLALALWAVYGALAFAGRVLLQLIRTGSTGVAGLSGSPGSIEWTAGALFLGALVLAVAAPILDLNDVVDAIGSLDTAGFHVAGIVLFALGLIGTLAAQLAMGRSWRIGVDEEERTDLVTGGPFTVVRNPIYSAMLPTVAGLTLLVPSVVALAGFALLVIALEIQVRVVEEPHLLRAHGDAYASYAGRVGRFVPGLGRLR
ncbi:MAG: methyltransferase family protein [Solirubrobacterales bacterium]